MTPVSFPPLSQVCQSCQHISPSIYPPTFLTHYHSSLLARLRHCAALWSHNMFAGKWDWSCSHKAPVSVVFFWWICTSRASRLKDAVSRHVSLWRCCLKTTNCSFEDLKIDIKKQQHHFQIIFLLLCLLSLDLLFLFQIFPRLGLSLAFVLYAAPPPRILFRSIKWTDRVEYAEGWREVRRQTGGHKLYECKTWKEAKWDGGERLKKWQKMDRLRLIPGNLTFSLLFCPCWLQASPVFFHSSFCKWAKKKRIF